MGIGRPSRQLPAPPNSALRTARPGLPGNRRSQLGHNLPAPCQDNGSTSDGEAGNTTSDQRLRAMPRRRSSGVSTGSTISPTCGSSANRVQISTVSERNQSHASHRLAMPASPVRYHAMSIKFAAHRMPAAVTGSAPLFRRSEKAARSSSSIALTTPLRNAARRAFASFVLHPMNSTR